MTSAPILVAPCDEGRYTLDTDASEAALGAVLQQEQDGQLKVIAYASRALSRTERRYCITRKELLGVVFGLKQFRQHLLGRSFTIRTDYAALTFLKRMPEPIGQEGRWLDLLSEYNFEIQHRPGRAMGIVMLYRGDLAFEGRIRTVASASGNYSALTQNRLLTSRIQVQSGRSSPWIRWSDRGNSP